MQSMRNKQWKSKQWIMILLCCICIAVSTPASRSHAFGEGARGPDVYAVQGMLKSLGFYAGNIDGIYGPILKRGVLYFQYTYGLPQTGAIDGPTLQSILWAYGNLKIPRQSEPQRPPQQPQIPGLSSDEQRMVDLVNQERRQAGLSPLSVDLELARVARIKSQDMIQNQYFSHQSPTYGSPFEMIRNFGISFRTAGENIACNQSVEQAHRALMESKGHRENILNPNFTHIGIGIVKGGRCGEMYTQMFIGK